MSKINKCYKLHINFDDINIGNAIDILCEVGDVVFFDKAIYIWLNDEFNREILSNIIREKINIYEYYCETIEYDDVINQNTFITSWFSEHYNNYLIAEQEKRGQDALRQMKINIDMANALLDQRIAQAKQQAQKTSVEEKNILLKEDGANERY